MVCSSKPYPTTTVVTGPYSQDPDIVSTCSRLNPSEKIFDGAVTDFHIIPMINVYAIIGSRPRPGKSKSHQVDGDISGINGYAGAGGGEIFGEVVEPGGGYRVREGFNLGPDPRTTDRDHVEFCETGSPGQGHQN